MAHAQQLAIPQRRQVKGSGVKDWSGKTSHRGGEWGQNKFSWAELFAAKQKKAPRDKMCAIRIAQWAQMPQCELLCV